MESDEEYFQEFEEDMHILNVIDFGFPRRINARHNHFENLDDMTFFRRYRLTKETVLYVLEQIEHEIEFAPNLNNSVSPMNQLLLGLRFYASGGHLNSVAENTEVSVSSASRIVKRVSDALARLHVRYIKMPERELFIRENNKMFNVALFPRVIGLIDCTHVKIQNPGGEDGEIFRNRKGYFSINVQVVCNSDLKINDLVARWPGSSHDSTIFNNSNIKQRFVAGEFGNNHLLGDNGYPLYNFLLTPLLNPQTQAEHNYNNSHIRTRNGVERLFGIWKRRFPVLAYGMRLKVETVLTVISATAVLHNIARTMNEDEPPPVQGINAEEFQYVIENGQIPDVNNVDNNIINSRTNLINNYFSTL